MKTIDRIVLVISSAIIVLLGAAVLASVPGAGYPNSFAMNFYGTLLENKILTVAASVLVVLVVLYLVSLALRSEDDRKPIVVTTGMGEVQISMAAVESIARRVAKAVRGVRDADARADSADGEPAGAGVVVSLRLEVTSDSGIPAVVEQIERDLAEAINTSCGVPLKKVRTFVKSIGPESNKLS